MILKRQSPTPELDERIRHRRAHLHLLPHLLDRTLHLVVLHDPEQGLRLAVGELEPDPHLSARSDATLDLHGVRVIE